jgi:hypothetical protein
VSCSKCQPQANSKRWLWWLPALALLSAVGWFESARNGNSARTQAEPPLVTGARTRHLRVRGVRWGCASMGTRAS